MSNYIGTICGFAFVNQDIRFAKSEKKTFMQHDHFDLIDIDTKKQIGNFIKMDDWHEKNLPSKKVK